MNDYADIFGSITIKHVISSFLCSFFLKQKPNQKNQQRYQNTRTNETSREQHNELDLNGKKKTKKPINQPTQISVEKDGKSLMVFVDESKNLGIKFPQKKHREDCKKKH
jgi:hypothetical protein